MSKKNEWKHFGLHFRQTYRDGFRYLDKGGEFLTEATQSLGFICDDVKPTGVKMSIPEVGLTLQVDVQGVVLNQEFATDKGSEFLRVCKGSTQLAQRLFLIQCVDRNTMVSRSILSADSAEDAAKMSLGLVDKQQDAFADLLGMTPFQRSMEYFFSSGSQHVTISTKPVAFTSVSRKQYAPEILSTKASQERVGRLNKQSSRVSNMLPYAFMMEIGLHEDDPPVASLDSHVDRLFKIENMIQAAVGLK